MAESTGVASTCQGCLTNCSVIVDVEGGVVVGVRGNPASKATCGAICKNVNIAAQQASDPDRLLHPMRRTNPKKGRFEHPGFRRISWDEALDELADRLIELRNQGESHRVVVAKGRSTGIGGLMTSAFPMIYGTPNSLNHDSICNQGETVALGCLDGIWDYRDIEYGGCEYLIMWGLDPLASNRWKSRFVREISELSRRAHIVVVDPRLSLTAKAADEWIAVKPGTDGALACALAHVIVEEGLYDSEFVSSFTLGLPEWYEAVLRDATPEWAELVCGVSADDIRRIARGFARAGRHAVSWTSPGLAMAERGFYACMAAHALNGLVGSVEAEGGIVSYPSIRKGALPPAARFIDDAAEAALKREPIDHRSCIGFMSAKGGQVGAGQNVNSVPDAVLTHDPYDVEVLVTYWCNFAYSAPESSRWWDALSRIPFHVDITTHISESAWFADIVLPACHHMFETWGIVNSRQGGYACVSIEQPCVEAPGEALGDETDVPYLLAEKLAERGFNKLLEYYRTVTDPETGASPNNGSELGEYAVKTISRPLWGDCTWERVKQRGVLMSGAVVARGDLRGQADEGMSSAIGSKWFEFTSARLRQMIAGYAALHGLAFDDAMETLGYEARGDLACMPHYEPPVRVGDEREYPFVFAQHRSHASLEGRAANTPLFQELKGIDPGDEPWDDVVKIHPADMRKLGLSDGESVRVTSPVGSIEAHAKSWTGTREGVVVKCYGQGHWAYGEIAAGIGGNNNEIVPARWERITSSAVRHGGIVRVRIERVEG